MKVFEMLGKYGHLDVVDLQKNLTEISKITTKYFFSNTYLPHLVPQLLLHHVIPGAFDVASLQDEMTGVSLAGTQLRVNQYDMHDVEWNEVRVTTINGARVLDDKKDIHIPQVISTQILYCLCRISS